MINNRAIDIQGFKDFCTNALIKEGMTNDYAKITSEVLCETDLFGTHSHGTKNLHNYIRKIRAGGMNLNDEIEIISEGPSYTHIDANSIIGMVPAYKAMNMAIEKSEITGVGVSVVRNASHFGAAGFYALMAARKGKIGVVLSNVDANMTIPGARGKVLGNNPLSYAVPSGKYPPVFLDIAMSTVASLKVVQARKDGKDIPETWIVDKDGIPTTDPSNYPEEGAMQPMAAHKGYGLSLMVEILTGVLSGGGTMGEVPSWLFSMEEKNDVSHTFISIDIDKFLGTEAFNKRMELMIETLHSTAKAEGTDRIFYPGEMEWERYEKAEKSGLVLPADVIESLRGLSEEMEITLPLI